MVGVEIHQYKDEHETSSRRYSATRSTNNKAPVVVVAVLTRNGGG
jgi:hypothetical protein